MMPRRVLFFLSCLLISWYSTAAENAKQLAVRHQCFGCHAVGEARAGPAFQQVAERYGMRQDALAYLLTEVKNGSVGKWGETPMPPEAVPDAELKQILQWVIQQ